MTPSCVMAMKSQYRRVVHRRKPFRECGPVRAVVQRSGHFLARSPVGDNRLDERNPCDRNRRNTEGDASDHRTESVPSPYIPYTKPPEFKPRYKGAHYLSYT
jgi:hypothetical protein